MKVNMTPNPLDAVTIHASQGDTEARQWEFELHNNGELIDTSDVKEQMVFKAYKGGTEQILPENGAVPVTAPFVGDIQYPDATRNNQEFTYRQSPTESDGLARIDNIKGNTIVWNQIFKPQYRSQSGIQSNDIQDGNDYSVRIFGTATANAWIRMDATGTLPVGHKFLLDKGSTSNLFDINNDNNGLMVDFSAKTKIGTVTTANKYIYIFVGSGTTIDVTVKPILIDLTKMFGSGNEPSTIEDFASLFPLSYYSYNQGSLLSFNGTGLKTTGKNLIEPSFVDDTIQGVSYKYNADGSITCSGHSTANTSQFALQPGRSANIVRGAYYFLSGGNDQVRLRITTFDSSGTVVRRNNASTATGNLRMMFNDDEVGYNVTAFPASANIDIDCTIYPQFEISYDKTSREPYTSSTLSLPISTYFPTGMKSAGNVYDELTESKAITRIGSVDLGSLAWGYSTGGSGRFQTTGIASSVKIPSTDTGGNILCEKYTKGNASQVYSGTAQICIQNGSGQIWVYDPSFSGNVSDFTSAMNGVYLYYELATPTETSFTTASLVTENAEIPLSNEDGTLIGKCTEQLSENPGFIDAKIKLSDSDGECYSNKIQLHVERSPQ